MKRYRSYVSKFQYQLNYNAAYAYYNTIALTQKYNSIIAIM